ncbi:histidine kinase-like ATPase [Phakopsora pachyrhizi]|uniref:Protein-serine/threonine kinase n=1 Tax=Phakopsora pachyrhizi TaxID=170000 RepID=A0AAV0B051_PHAPC|nr:histidine kinase-like ATPase [Phakopsora pachyrhizi]
MRFGSPPLKESRLIESAELTRLELIERLQRRVNAHLSLPYLPASNPHTSAVTSIYSQSLDEIKALPPIRDLNDNNYFVTRLEKMVEDATDVIGKLAKGFQESNRYLTKEEISSFLDRAIKNLSSSSMVGIVDKRLDLRRTIEAAILFVKELCEGVYGISPDWVIDGPEDARVCFIGMHLQYALIEVLKNAFRATVENSILGTHESKASDVPRVEVTFSIQEPVYHSSNTDSKDLTVHQRADQEDDEMVEALLNIRVRDYGGGIEPGMKDQVFSYAFSTVDAINGKVDASNDFDRVLYGDKEVLKSGLGKIAGLGYGLPMSRIYCRYFGGNLELVSMYGEGGSTDTYLTMRVGKS